MKLKSTLLLFFAFGITIFAQTKTVDGEVTGEYYNQVWDMMTEQPVIVYVDLAQNVYIRGGAGVLAATGYVPGRRLREVIALLEKSGEWSKKALEHKLEITKSLGSFMTGEEDEKQGFEMFFTAASKGQNTFVTLKIQDFDNMFNNIKIILEQKQVLKLIALLKKAPATYKELKTQKAKSDILQ